MLDMALFFNCAEDGLHIEKANMGEQHIKGEEK